MRLLCKTIPEVSEAVLGLFSCAVRPACGFSHDICERIYPTEVFTASVSAGESAQQAEGSPDWADTFRSAHFLASSEAGADTDTVRSCAYASAARRGALSSCTDFVLQQRSEVNRKKI